MHSISFANGTAKVDSSSGWISGENAVSVASTVVVDTCDAGSKVVVDTSGAGFLKQSRDGCSLVVDGKGSMFSFFKVLSRGVAVVFVIAGVDERIHCCCCKGGAKATPPPCISSVVWPSSFSKGESNDLGFSFLKNGNFVDPSSGFCCGNDFSSNMLLFFGSILGGIVVDGGILHNDGSSSSLSRGLSLSMLLLL